MCSDRLAAGEAPACVQACPHEAIRIRVVDMRGRRRGCAEAGDVPAGGLRPVLHAADDPLPTRSAAGDCRPADDYALKPAHAHTPLVVMLVLTQLSVGAFLIELIVAAGVGSADGVGSASLGLSLGSGVCRPGGEPAPPRPAALRLPRGPRAAALVAEPRDPGVRALRQAGDGLRRGRVARSRLALPTDSLLRAVALSPVVVAGLCGVGCSVMVYTSSAGPFWRASIERRQVRRDDRSCWALATAAREPG